MRPQAGVGRLKPAPPMQAGDLGTYSPLVVAIALLALTYLLLVQVVKTWFYRRHDLL